MTNQQQITVLAVHTSQLTRDYMATLVDGGYSVLPDQTGWLIFLRTQPPTAPQTEARADG